MGLRYFALCSDREPLENLGRHHDTAVASCSTIHM